MADPAGIDRDRLRRISEWMSGSVAAGRLSGLAVQISHRGQVVYSEKTGLRDARAGLAVEDDTIWRIYSMTKPITCLAALMLYEEGGFLMEQPVSDFLPGFGSAGVWAGGDAPLDRTVPLARPVTMHDLFTHQSGLGYGDTDGTLLEQAHAAIDPVNARPGETMAQTVDKISALPLWFQPGQHWFYGTSHDVLGRVIEVISGQTLGEVLQSRICAPLGMVDTGFAVRPDQARRMAACYAPGPHGLRQIAPTDDPDYRAPVTMERGGGGLVSTMPDYQRFASMLLNRGIHDGQRLLGRKTFQMMVANQIGGDRASRGPKDVTDIPGAGYGLGVSVMLDPVRARTPGSVGDFGWGGFASTTFWVDPAKDLTVILMTQLIPHTHFPLWRELRVLTYQALA